MNAKGHALAVAVLTELQKRVAAMLDEHRGAVGSLLDKGDRVSVRSPLSGEGLGTVTMTDPKPKAMVTDPEELDDWIAEHYPEKTEWRRVVVGSEDEVLAVLAEHAPHLVTTQRHVPDWARAEVLRASAEAGVPCGPGGEADVPGVAVEPQPGRLQYRATAGSGHAIDALVQAGLVDLTSGEVRELPQAGEAA